MKPWNAISTVRTYCWYSHGCDAMGYALYPRDAPEERVNFPAMRVYQSLTALSIEVSRAWAFVSMGVRRQTESVAVNEAWLFDTVEKWILRATTNVDKCPAAFRDILRPRVADAIARARIGNPRRLMLGVCTLADVFIRSGSVRGVSVLSKRGMGEYSELVQSHGRVRG